MKTIWSETIDSILCVGVPLENIGVFNWALTKSQALKSLNKFLDLQICLLGGDVYENNNGVIRANYDNWYCDQLQGEEKNAYIKRSIEKAKDFIEAYKSKNMNIVLFALVLR